MMALSDGKVERIGKYPFWNETDEKDQKILYEHKKWWNTFFFEQKIYSLNLVDQFDISLQTSIFKTCTATLTTLFTQISQLSARINHFKLPGSVHTTHVCEWFKTKRPSQASDISQNGVVKTNGRHAYKCFRNLTNVSFEINLPRAMKFYY